VVGLQPSLHHSIMILILVPAYISCFA
jgi:hypothetical protein